MKVPAAGLSVALLLFASSAQAQENRLDLKTDNAQSRKGDDIDNIITNKQLRAASGSKSRWSLGSSLDYSGGSLRRPFDEDRPNIAGTTATTDKALLEGKFDGKFNFSDAHSLSLGMGVRWITPFAKGRPKNYDGERFDAANPFLTYQYLYNWAGMQSVLQVQPTLYTESDLTALGYSSSLLINQDSVFEIGASRLSLGFSVWAQYGQFTKNDEDSRAEQSDYLFGLSPLVEYAFNDVFNFRTVFNLWNFEHLRSQTAFNTYVTDRPTQSMGLGISVTRDIFIYPNVQFVPENIRADLTNVGLSADVSVF